MRSTLPVMVLAMLAGFFGGLLAQHSIASAQGTPGVVTARDFRVIDSNGQVIAELGPSTTHVWRAVLHINGYDGHFADLGATNLVLGSGRGGELGVGYVTRNGQPETTAIFFYAGGKGRMLLGLDDTRSAAPYIHMYNEVGRRIWNAP